MGEQPPEPIRRDEAEALLATRAELGPPYDAELVGVNAAHALQGCRRH